MGQTLHDTSKDASKFVDLLEIGELFVIAMDILEAPVISARCSVMAMEEDFMILQNTSAKEPETSS